ncbi:MULTISPECIES: EamA family transporter [unclassified Streptomyces]|uniref:EamA family transporter n=1 Tax=unclassified Streptomyces TaxID=2593676 RepID=UPI00386CBC7B
MSTTALPAGGVESGHITAVGVIAVVILGIFGTGFTFALNYRLIADEGATNAATVGCLLPVVSIALGALVLDKALAFRTVAGMVVVLAGAGPARWQKRTNSASPLVTAGQAVGSRTAVR